MLMLGNNYSLGNVNSKDLPAAAQNYLAAGRRAAVVELDDDVEEDDESTSSNNAASVQRKEECSTKKCSTASMPQQPLPGTVDILHCIMKICCTDGRRLCATKRHTDIFY